MQKREDNYQSRFATADDMVASALPHGTHYRTVPGVMDVSAFETLLKSLGWLLLGVAFALVLKLTVDISLETAIVLMLLPFFIYSFIKGVRSRPDAMAISDHKIWLFTDVLYNSKTKTWGFGELYEIAKDEIKRGWVFQRFTIKFKVPGKIKVKHQQNIFMRIAKYYHHNPVGIGEAKKLLYGR